MDISNNQTVPIMPTGILPTIYHGVCLSAGLADGLIALPGNGGRVGECADGDLSSGMIDRQQIAGEQCILNDAITKVTGDLVALATKVEQEISSPLAQVFDVHRMIANDDSLRKEIDQEITDNLIAASAAVRLVFGRWEERYRLIGSSVASSKGDDMADVCQRLLCSMTDPTHHPLVTLQPGRVLVRSRLLPSDTVLLINHLPVAVILEHGSYGSHAALFMREMGLPCIVGCPKLHRLGYSLSSIRALVDASAGQVILQPDAETVATFEGKRQKVASDIRHAQAQAQEPALTTDGRRIMVMANIGTVKDATRAVKNGADGIGLFRTEQIYLGRLAPPDVHELVVAMREIFLPFSGKPICVRLLDAGADKQLPFLNFLAEPNPALGRRGIRLLRAYPNLLDTGLRAMVELAQEFTVSILIPMVSVVEDITAVSTALDRICAEMDCVRPQLGAMIETPAAALNMHDLRSHLDFFSFGTNDLTQYCFAADRDSVTVDDYFLDADAAIFRLMHLACQAAPDIPAAICGELAGQAKHIDQLIGAGITSLSVAPPAIANIKEAVRKVRWVAAGSQLTSCCPMEEAETK